MAKFSEWETEALDQMAKQTGIRCDYHATRFEQIRGSDSLNIASLLAHLVENERSYLNPRGFEVVAERWGCHLWSVSVDPPLFSSVPDRIELAWAADPPKEAVSPDHVITSSKDRIDQLQKLIVEFDEERRKRIEPIRENLKGIRESYAVVRSNMKGVINDIDDLKFKGECRTEKELKKPSKL